MGKTAYHLFIDDDERTRLCELSAQSEAERDLMDHNEILHKTCHGERFSLLLKDGRAIPDVCLSEKYTHGDKFHIQLGTDLVMDVQFDQVEEILPIARAWADDIHEYVDRAMAECKPITLVENGGYAWSCVSIVGLTPNSVSFEPLSSDADYDQGWLKLSDLMTVLSPRQFQPIVRDTLHYFVTNQREQTPRILSVRWFKEVVWPFMTYDLTERGW